MNGTNVNANVPGKCPQCGAPLPAGALAGFCPACLLQQGAASDTGTQPVARPFEPPPVAEVARLFPQLEILGFLGKGGMGAVYKARQPELDRLVALKILPAREGSDSGFAERFNREARALARLSHPNIVGVYEFGRVDGLHFFLMEFVDGVNLRQLQKAGRLSAREALQIVPQICDALQYAHDEGIVHRDIKPENVLVDRKGRVKIADFGLAKIVGSDAQDLRLTGEGQVMGTPHYMAPEQVEHPLEVDHRADIFSLGVVFYEMLTGELPLGRFQPPSSKVQVDVRLDEIVLHALEKEPTRRYQHANDVKTAVQSVTSGSAPAPAQSTGPTIAVQMPRWAMGVDYRSKATLFGLPLLHIATGMDPNTGKKRIATGIIAFGDIARGGIAVGGMAMGGLAFGGLAVGGIAVGGVGVGLISFSGMALALLLAFGGGAVALLAIGGGAVGYFAFGGGAWGAHTLGGNGSDPAAWDFFESWVGPFMRIAFFGMMTASMIAMMSGVFLPVWIQRHNRNQMPRIAFWGQIAAALFSVVIAVVILISVQPRFGFPELYLVSGSVIDAATSTPVGNATLIISSTGNREYFGETKAGVQGKFAVTTRRGGNQITVSAPGYEEKRVNLTPGTFDRKRHARMEFKLSPSQAPGGVSRENNQARENP